MKKYRLLIFFGLITVSLLMSCRDAKYHLDKFYSKGGKITCDTIYVEKIDTLVVKGKDGKDSLIYITKQVPCNCPQVTIETRWKTRFDNKRFADSMEVIADMYADSLKAATKQNKQNKKAETTQTKYEERSGFPWWMLFLSLILLITFFIIKQFKR
jgi:hypothetical protein